MATWRNGYAEDCKSLYPGSIPGVACKKNLVLTTKKAFDWLLLALSLLHGTNGLRVVLHDNISDQTVRKLSLSVLYVTSTVFFILGTYVIVAFVSKL